MPAHEKFQSWSYLLFMLLSSQRQRKANICSLHEGRYNYQLVYHRTYVLVKYFIREFDHVP